MKTNGKSVYEIVTEKIINRMEQGEIPWFKPWDCEESEVAINYITRKPYSLLNQLLLGKGGEYLSYKQLTDKGGTLKEGAERRLVTFWKENTWLKKVEDEETGEVLEEVRNGFLLRYYYVYHLKDIEGIESKIVKKEIKKRKRRFNTLAEEVIKKYKENNKPLLISEEKSNRAFYAPLRDSIIVPLRTQFHSLKHFYHTLFHEMAHSTGHKDRLNRSGITNISAGFGTKEYSIEELVAEMSSAMLCSKIGIDSKELLDNTTAYIQSWLKALKNNPKWIVFASSQAEKATKYILNEQEGE